MKEILKVLSIDKDRVMDNMISRVKDPSLTYATKISEIVKKEGFLEGHMNLSIEYRDDAFNNRYKFQGYEDLRTFYSNFNEGSHKKEVLRLK